MKTRSDIDIFDTFVDKIICFESLVESKDTANVFLSQALNDPC